MDFRGDLEVLFCYSSTFQLLIYRPKLDTHPITQEFCAEHMLHALFDGEKGVFLRNDMGDIVGSRVFNESQSHIYDYSSDSPAYTQEGIVNGTPLTGYSGSDMHMRLLMLHTEEVTKTSHM
jgi:hypothetical protein